MLLWWGHLTRELFFCMECTKCKENDGHLSKQ